MNDPNASKDTEKITRHYTVNLFLNLLKGQQSFILDPMTAEEYPLSKQNNIKQNRKR
jgi:hypothetical protein